MDINCNKFINIHLDLFFNNLLICWVCSHHTVLFEETNVTFPISFNTVYSVLVGKCVPELNRAATENWYVGYKQCTKTKIYLYTSGWEPQNFLIIGI